MAAARADALGAPERASGGSPGGLESEENRGGELQENCSQLGHIGLAVIWAILLFFLLTGLHGSHGAKSFPRPAPLQFLYFYMLYFFVVIFFCYISIWYINGCLHYIECFFISMVTVCSHIAMLCCSLTAFSTAVAFSGKNFCMTTFRFTKYKDGGNKGLAEVKCRICASSVVYWLSGYTRLHWLNISRCYSSDPPPVVLILYFVYM